MSLYNAPLSQVNGWNLFAKTDSFFHHRSHHARPIDIEELSQNLKSPAFYETFMCSTTAVAVTAFVLGVRDRSKGISLLDKVGHFFHMDIRYASSSTLRRLKLLSLTLSALFKTSSDGRFALPKELRNCFSAQDYDVFNFLVLS